MIIVLFFVHVPPLGWLGAMIIVLFFVHVPPLGWLGAMIIVLFFVCVPPLGWLGDIIIVFIIVIERVRCSIFGCECVQCFRGGVRFPNEVGVW